MTTEEYLTDLAVQLHALGLDQRRIEEVLGEVDDHLVEGGDDPVTELGPAREYALRIQDAAVREGTSDDAEWQHWAFRADAWAEMNLLEHLGREGWEVIEVRRDAHFACRRHAVDPQPWAYRRRASMRPRRTGDEMEGQGWVPLRDLDRLPVLQAAARRDGVAGCVRSRPGSRDRPSPGPGGHGTNTGRDPAHQRCTATHLRDDSDGLSTPVEALACEFAVSAPGASRRGST